MEQKTNRGVSNLGAVLSQRMQKEGASPLVLDFGQIQDDYSLKTNTFAKPIPKGDYSICRQLTLGDTNGHLTYTIGAGNAGDGTHSHGSSGPHSHGGGTHGGHISGSGDHSHSGDGQHVHTNEGPHIHDVLVPEKMRSIAPGDRVLVAWVQNEAVVIDIVTKL